MLCSFGFECHHQQVKQPSPAFRHVSPQRLSWEDSVVKHGPVVSWSLQLSFSSQLPKAELTGCAVHSYQCFGQPPALSGPQAGTSYPIPIQN